MLPRQTQRVHEHHGHPKHMAMNSRVLLAASAIGAVLIAAISNVVQGGTTLTLLLVASTLTLVFLIGSMFNGKAKNPSSGSTLIRAPDSIGKAPALHKNEQSSNEQHIPDPLEAGFDAPLM